jgi:hypothetical protein
MSPSTTRRNFLKGLSAAGAGTYWASQGSSDAAQADPAADRSTIFRVIQCPVPGGGNAHEGVDTLLALMAKNGVKFYKTSQDDPFGGPAGLIDKNDVVLVKVNCQWKFRGATNTDVLRGLVHRLLNHPDGFSGEVVIFENGQEEGSFDGDPDAWGRYESIGAPPGVHVNAEDDQLTVDQLVNVIFSGQPVSSFLLDNIRSVFITDPNDHATNGYRAIDEVSYPCFTTTFGNRVNLKDGLWTGSGYDSSRLKFINVPVLKTHTGTGITGVLKHMYGVLSMQDGYRPVRHYDIPGAHCGKMWTLARAPDLNIVDCIWVTYATHHCGWPPSTTSRRDELLAGTDPVALDYWGAKHLLYPLGGDRQQHHDPDVNSETRRHILDARSVILAAGGTAVIGDENIDVLLTAPNAARTWPLY